MDSKEEVRNEIDRGSRIRARNGLKKIRLKSVRGKIVSILSTSCYLIGGAVVDGASLLVVGLSSPVPLLAAAPAAAPPSSFFSVETSGSEVLGMNRC